MLNGDAGVAYILHIMIEKNPEENPMIIVQMYHHSSLRQIQTKS